MNNEAVMKHTEAQNVTYRTRNYQIDEMQCMIHIFFTILNRRHFFSILFWIFQASCGSSGENDLPLRTASFSV